MKPMFTIGIASYNYANYLLIGLNAIKSQSFKDYEILISDDASTDNSIEVIEKFIENNPDIKVRLIKKSVNEGLIANKNTLIENCNGEYLMLCDADDWMRDDCLEKFAEVIKKDHPDRIISQVVHIDTNGKIIQTEIIPEHQTKWGWNLHHGTACKTEILRKNDIKILAEPDDVYFTIELAKHCNNMSIIQEPLYYWLVHRDSEGRRKKKNYNLEYVNRMFIREFEFLNQTIEELDRNQEENDIEELRIVFLKLYYFDILFGLQQLPLSKKIEYYKFLHKKMEEIDNNYLKNRYLSFREIPILRSYALKAIRLCVIMEKLHIMVPMLVIYHILGKFVYFDQ